MGRTTVVLAVALFVLGAVGMAATTPAGMRARAAYLESCGGSTASPADAACAALDVELHAWEALGYLSAVAVVVGLLSTLVQVFPRQPRPAWTRWYGARGKRWT